MFQRPRLLTKIFRKALRTSIVSLPNSPDGAKSIVSDAACVTLKNDSPLMTHVSNDSIDLVSGQVVTRWSKPKEIDGQYVAPFRYALTRIFDGTSSIVYEGSDTIFLDANVDLAQATSLIYKVQMRDANQQLMGESATASAVMLSANGTINEAHLSWTEAVPWLVDSTLVFKEVEQPFCQDRLGDGDGLHRYRCGKRRHLSLLCAHFRALHLGGHHAAFGELFGYQDRCASGTRTDGGIFLQLPNVFTPNGDGFNDVFEPKVTGLDLITGAKTVIFNRWGNILWDTDDPLIQWDGKSKQTKMDCPPGTYFYICDITYQSETGEEKLHLQGSITIVR